MSSRKHLHAQEKKTHPTFAIIPKPFKDMFIKKEDNYRELQII